MNRIVTYTLAIALLGARLIAAQTVPITGGPACYDCVPAGWTKTSGNPDVSTIGGIGSSVNGNDKWGSSPASPPSGNGTFLSLLNNSFASDAASTKITGLIAGTKYHLKYNVYSASTAATQGEYGTSATVKLRINGSFPVNIASEVTNFGSFDINSWKAKTITFTAIADYVDLTFSGTANANGGYVFLDIGPNAVFSTCLNAPSQVSLNKNTLNNVCPSKTVDINTSVNGNPPAGLVLKWYSNDTHSGSAVVDPTKAVAGDYYAFFYSSAEDCFNTHKSTAKITVNKIDCVNANLTPTIEMDALNFNEGANRDFVVNIYEVADGGTLGAVTFRISKLGAFNISYPTISGNSKVYGSTPNQNSNWSFTEDANFITATLKSGLKISALNQAIIGFNAARKLGTPSKTIQNLSIVIPSGSGGDNSSTNNKSINSLSSN